MIEDLNHEGYEDLTNLIDERHMSREAFEIQHSQEFMVSDYENIMGEVKTLGNVELIKNVKSIKALTDKSYNKNIDILEPPLREDADHYYFYVMNCRRPEDHKTWLDNQIANKLQSPYTHSACSLDIRLTSVMGFLTYGLTRESPDYYGLKGYGFKAKRGYDIYGYKITPEEYKKGRKLFSNYMMNMKKYSYDFLGLAKPLIYKLNENKMPVQGKLLKEKNESLEEMAQKDKFICSLFVLFSLVSISDSARAWWEKAQKEENLVTSCFNPASIPNIPGMKLMLHIPPSKDIKTRDVIEAWLKKNPNHPN